VREIRSSDDRVLAATNARGEWRCAECRCWLQRTSNGDIRDGVIAHYKTVHPERNVR
jgi:hypothetical protein